MQRGRRAMSPYEYDGETYDISELPEDIKTELDLLLKAELEKEKKILRDLLSEEMQ